MTFTDCVAKLKEFGWTQRDVARFLSITPTSVSRGVRGERTIGKERTKKLIDEYVRLERLRSNSDQLDVLYQKLRDRDECFRKLRELFSDAQLGDSGPLSLRNIGFTAAEVAEIKRILHGV